MAKFKCLTRVQHNLTDYPKDAIMELDPDGTDAIGLLGAKAIERVREEPPVAPEAKPVEKFSAPTSHAEVEKATISATLAPVRTAKCPKCKEVRELVNVQVSEQNGIIRMLGDCSICGRRVSRMMGRAKKG